LIHKRIVILSGIFYTIGRSITYTILGIVMVKAMVNIPLLSDFLQRYMNKILGPLLIIVGIYLLDLLKIKINLFNVAPSEKMQERLDNAGIIGSFLLGAIFSLSFCPISAALFFGALIPLAIKADFMSIWLPLIYGAGTGLPVLLFAF
ncbi:sulfite exporter TauE/SafE family protein, partial [Escherichia coli]|uniref:urease accessory protein UreH domain-containing protein n=1 Tax=Escherichia coli TaxID=562 RepID=UPI0012BE75A8